MRLRPDEVPAPPCPACGEPVDIDWFEARGLGNPEPTYHPGRLTCTGSQYHDVRAARDDIRPIRIVHDGEDDRECCRLTLGEWRQRGWRPADPELQTPGEMVEQRVADLARDTP